MTWREIRDQLNGATDEVLDSHANVSCDPLESDAELGLRYMGVIRELNPIGDPQRTTGIVACFDGELNK